MTSQVMADPATAPTITRVTITEERPAVGTLLREWRTRRRLSQLELSLDADVSARHVSFVENGKSRPTAEMIERLATCLDVPLRERNELLLAGGFAPRHPEHDLHSTELAAVTAGLRSVLDAHDPLPAFVLDRRWDVVDHNDGAQRLVSLCAPHLQEPPVNALRASLHPDGLAPMIQNLAQWRGHLIGQLRARIARTADRELEQLLAEIDGYPVAADTAPAAATVLLPLVIRLGDQTLRFFSMASAVETAADVTVDELVLETFYPADAATAAAFGR